MISWTCHLAKREECQVKTGVTSKDGLNSYYKKRCTRIAYGNLDLTNAEEGFLVGYSQSRFSFKSIQRKIVLWAFNVILHCFNDNGIRRISASRPTSKRGSVPMSEGRPSRQVDQRVDQRGELLTQSASRRCPDQVQK